MNTAAVHGDVREPGNPVPRGFAVAEFWGFATLMNLRVLIPVKLVI